MTDAEAKSVVTQAEDVLWPLGQTPFCASVNVASGIKLAESIARTSVEVTAAREFFEKNPALFPVIGDFIRRLVGAEPGEYDAACLGLLVLTQQVYGSLSAEMKTAAVIAANLKNSFWTRDFLSQWAADSQSGA